MATLHFVVLKTRQTVKKTYLIYLAITHKRVVRYITTKFEVEDLYQFDNGKVVCRVDARVFNQRLDYVLSEYQRKLDLIINQDSYSCSQIKGLLEKNEAMLNKQGYITLIECFQNRIKELRDEGRESYADMNEETLKRIKASLGDVTLASINPYTIEVFIKSLGSYSNATKQMSLSHIKACINLEIRKGHVKYLIHPFAYTKMPKAPAKLLDLTIEEFTRILNYQTRYRKETLARDLFLLSFYLGGMNLIDIVKINFKEDEVCYIRSKTSNKREGDKTVTFTIPEEAKQIIQKYISKNGKLNFGYQFSYRNFQSYVNHCLKDLGKKLDIKSNISFYSARKTFSQFAFDLGIRTEIVEYCLGQSMKENRPIYNYIRVMRKQADAAIQKVINYTENPEKYELNILES